MCVFPLASNEISCPRECTNRASIAPGDVYQLAAPSDSRRMSALQICIADTQTPLKESTQFYLCFRNTHSFTYREGFSGTSVLFSPPQHTHRGYYGKAYQQPELIKPYLQPLMCTQQPRACRIRHVGLLILGLDGHSINS